VGRGVDAQRQPAGDGQAAQHQFGGEAPGIGAALGRGIAGADQGQLRQVQQVEIAMREKRERCPGDLREAGGIARIVEGDEVPVRCRGEPGEVGFGAATIRLRECGDLRVVAAGFGPGRGPGGEDGGSAAATLQQAAGAHRTEARHA
jgi:hypothetical protein